MKTHVYLGVVLAFAVSALTMPSRHATGYYEPDYCCPKIVPALGGKEHSVIEPTHDCSVQVSIVNDWGSCTPASKGFWWFVDWNDTTIEQGCTTNLGPVGPRIHKYTGCGYYYKEGYKYYTGVEACVTFYYCSSIDSELGHCSYNADCCDAIVKCVTLY